MIGTLRPPSEEAQCAIVFFFLRRNSEQWAGTRPTYYKHFLIFTFSRNCVALAVKPDALLFIRGPTVLQEPKQIIKQRPRLSEVSFLKDGGHAIGAF